MRLFGGNVLTEIGWALCLAASAHAYGADLGLAQALVVNMCASVFASVMPVPGGIGVAEASLAAGMMAFGVPQSEAYAAALTHRLATFYLPPIWGWFSLALPHPQGLPVTPIDARLKGMVRIPGGEFRMGSDRFYPEEQPVHRVSVDELWMDEHPVTVAEFRRFVKDTGHVTDAERTPIGRGLSRRGSRAARRRVRSCSRAGVEPGAR